jgi:hypothetical protein
MRFMMFMYPDDSADRAGARPTAEEVGQMTKYNEELARAGVLLALDGLHPSDTGARVAFPGGKPKVTDGPFREAKDIVGGYWMIQCKSKEEAIEWAKRIPPLGAKFVEVRQVFEMSDFPADVQAAAHNPAVKASLGA